MLLVYENYQTCNVWSKSLFPVSYKDANPDAKAFDAFFIWNQSNK